MAAQPPPPGAMARGSVPQMMDPYTPATQVGVNARRLAADLPVIHQMYRKTRSEVQKVRAETRFTDQNTWNLVQQAAKIVAETGLTNEQILLTMAQTGLVDSQKFREIQQASTLSAQERLLFAQADVTRQQQRLVQNEVEILDTQVSRAKAENKWVLSFIGNLMIHFGLTAAEIVKMFQVISFGGK